MKNILLIGLGGGIGSIARYLCQRWMLIIYPHSFPFGTFAVNVVGCFLIGIFWGLSFRSFNRQELRRADPRAHHDVAMTPQGRLAGCRGAWQPGAAAQSEYRNQSHGNH